MNTNGERCFFVKMIHVFMHAVPGRNPRRQRNEWNYWRSEQLIHEYIDDAAVMDG